MTLTTSQAASHHRRRRHRLIRIVAVLLSALALPVAVAAVSIPRAAGQIYPPRPATLPSVTRSHPQLDLGRPTVAIVLGADGANAADTLAPFEVFARSGGFNVVLVGPTSLPVPLTGGLDVIPDFTFAELADRLPRAPEVVVVPQVNGDARPAVEWVAAQHAAGTSVVMSVCVGARHVADAGLLDGRRATSNWLGLIGLRRSHPQVRWVAGERFVDDGDVITSAAVLSGIDGSLRIVERFLGPEEANRVADELRWSGYRPGQSTAIPAEQPTPSDLVAVLSASYRWDRPAVGVLLTEGVSEVALAAAFRPYTELAYLAVPLAVTGTGSPIRSQHGLTFLPRASWPVASGHVQRLLVPGQGAAADADLTALSPQPRTVARLAAGQAFPFDGALQDVARTYDVATAAWVAKSLQYPLPHLNGDEPAWPWGLTLRAAALAVLGGLVAWAIGRIRRPTTSV